MENQSISEYGLKRPYSSEIKAVQDIDEVQKLRNSYKSSKCFITLQQDQAEHIAGKYICYMEGRTLPEQLVWRSLE